MKAAVYCKDLSAVGGQTLYGSYPEFRIRNQRILDKYRQLRSFQCISYFLYQKRIACGTGTDPDGVYSVFQYDFHVSGICHFGSGFHAGGLSRVA